MSDIYNDDLSWLKQVRENLHGEWQTKTEVENSDCDVESLACSLVQAINQNMGHLSIACSLQRESQQINKLLNTSCFDDDPVLFFRLLLFLIDEFTTRMHECYELLKKRPIPKRPTLICVWTNKYAKHRTAILIQHHAQHLFGDELNFDETKASLEKNKSVFIDTSWLKTIKKDNINLVRINANQDQISIILVPKLIYFINETIHYYHDFCKYACSVPKALEQFQSIHH